MSKNAKKDDMQVIKFSGEDIVRILHQALGITVAQFDQQASKPKGSATMAAPKRTAPAKTERACIVDRVTQYVDDTIEGPTGADYRAAYKKAFRELKLRCHVDVEARRRKSHKHWSCMDVVNDLDLMPELLSIVEEIYPLDSEFNDEEE